MDVGGRIFTEPESQTPPLPEANRRNFDRGENPAFPATIGFVSFTIMHEPRDTIKEILARPWSPDSWQLHVASLQPVYPDDEAVRDVVERLSRLPPLVTTWEIENLKQQMADAAAGNSFLLQGGDCSERIDDCETDSIVRNLKVLIQMSFVLTYASHKRIIRVGRVAGQYAKPRSSETETRNGVTLPVFRGDNINRSNFSPQDRRADPELLIRGYERAALTLNFIRSLIGGGFADLHHPENWNLDFYDNSPRARQFHQMVDSIVGSLKFMETMLDRTIAQTRSVDVFTSHEGLHLNYEQAQTQIPPRRSGWYNLSGHFPWIGNRTRSLQGAHVEYFRGIENPIGIKIGGDLSGDDLVDLLDVLNPRREPGRITLIHRFGDAGIESALPPLIKAVQERQHPLLWSCDPMHGNTFQTRAGIKTRSFDAVTSELQKAFRIHRRHDSRLGGVHLELTGDNVTECVGGAGGLAESDLTRAYKSPVDPRLNYDQAMEIAFLIGDELTE
jgi:3-deoxy-7-phosphoheptulonate synthase